MATNKSSEIGFIKLNSRVKEPIRGTSLSAGFDLFSVDFCLIRSGSRELVSTGLSFVIPTGIYARIASRSSYAIRGIDVGAGVIDPDYKGEVKVLIINNSNKDLQIKEGERFAQVIFEFYHAGKIIELTMDRLESSPDENVIKVIRKEPNIRLPEKYTDDSVIFDFVADIAFLMQPKSKKRIDTGVKFIFSPKIYGYISGKLELASQGLDCVEGIIEADPNGEEAFIVLHNKSNLPIFIEKGEKIAKIIFVKNASHVNATSMFAGALRVDRGIHGFGSTGKE